MENIIDLHMHTTCSDGSLTPFEVVDEAVKNGVKIMAIADHDTMEAYSDELIKYAEEKGIRLIKAVEISTKNKKAGVHVLGYNIDTNNKKFQEDLLMKEFGHIPSKGEFIETIMNEGCPAFIMKKSITPVDAAELIRKAGEYVVLAHPVAYKYEDGVTEDEVLQMVIDMKIDAIEGNYVYVDRNEQKINEIALWNSFARRNKLLSTIGSDFHNFDGIRPVIGLVGEELEEVDIDSILKAIFKEQ